MENFNKKISFFRLYENIKESENKFDAVSSVMESYKRKFETERGLFKKVTSKITEKEKELSALHKQYSQTKAEHIQMSQKYKALEKEMADKLTNYNEMKKTLKTSEEFGKLKDNELETIKINMEKSTKQLANLKVVSKNCKKILFKILFNFLIFFRNQLRMKLL